MRDAEQWKKERTPRGTRPSSSYGPPPPNTAHKEYTQVDEGLPFGMGHRTSAASGYGLQPLTWHTAAFFPRLSKALPALALCITERGDDLLGHVVLNLAWRGHPVGAQALIGTSWRTQRGDSLGLCWHV